MRTRNTTTRNTISAAARKQFLAHGYAGTTLDKIAEQAGLTKRTIYVYFPDKKTLLASVIEEVIGSHWRIEELPSRVTTKQELYDELLALTEALESIITQVEYIQLLRIAVAEVHQQPDLVILFERSVTNRSYRIAMQLFREAANSHIVIIPNGAEAIARQFVGSFATPKGRPAQARTHTPQRLGSIHQGEFLL